jgi:murein L,D-transpeptidase YcbB/YkuD
MTRVALPDAGELQHIADDAVEAAEKAERGHIVDIGPARIDAPASPASPASQGSGLASKAAEVAKNVREKKYSYSRKLVSDYQAAAGLAADGIYGPATAASVSRYTDAPKALFASKRKAGK